MMNIEEIKRFYLYNSLEYSHQNMSRWQMNHIGHILNPLNEFVLGKPLKDIYIQYGLGRTFIIKWTMDLFGGISIDNYYKIYIYYVLYFIGFMGMLYILFRDPLYVLIGSLFLGGAYYFQGYIALMLAPGYKVLEIIKSSNYFPVMYLVKHLLWAIRIRKIRIPNIDLLHLPLKLGNIITIATKRDNS